MAAFARKPFDSAVPATQTGRTRTAARRETATVSDRPPVAVVRSRATAASASKGMPAIQHGFWAGRAFQAIRSPLLLVAMTPKLYLAGSPAESASVGIIFLTRPQLCFRDHVLPRCPEMANPSHGLLTASPSLPANLHECGKSCWWIASLARVPRPPTNSRSGKAQFTFPGRTAHSDFFKLPLEA